MADLRASQTCGSLWLMPQPATSISGPAYAGASRSHYRTSASMRPPAPLTPAHLRRQPFQTPRMTRHNLCLNQKIAALLPRPEVLSMVQLCGKS